MPTLRSAVALVVIAVGATLGVRAVAARSAAARQPVSVAGQPQTPDTVAVLAGGCFWGVDVVFRHVKGVHSVVSGYAGGTTTGASGRAEAVRITYDPGQVSYGTLLRVFFSVVHDPTQVDRQGPDRGSQYRSAIFPMSAEQQRAAESYVAQLTSEHAFDKPIATQISPLDMFSAAESYHQDYARKNPRSAYILINDAPKIAALERSFPELWRASPLE